MNNLWGKGTGSIEQKTITSVFDWKAAFGLPGHSKAYCLDPGKRIVSWPGAGFLLIENEKQPVNPIANDTMFPRHQVRSCLAVVVVNGQAIIVHLWLLLIMANTEADVCMAHAQAAPFGHSTVRPIDSRCY